MAAAARVFAIGELVEMILLELPTKDLLLSQRINRACKQAVDSSVRIQKALFFIPGLPEDINGPDVVSHWDRWPFSDSDFESFDDEGDEDISDEESSDEESPDEESPDEESSDEESRLDRRLAHPSRIILGRWGTEQAQKWDFGEDLAVMKHSGVAFNPLLVLDLSLSPGYPFKAILYETTLNLPEYASCFKMLTTQPPIEFPMVNFYWAGQENADPRFGGYQKSCSVPRSLEGSTVRKLARLVSNATEELEKEQNMKHNRRFHKLCLIACILEDPESRRLEVNLV